VVGYRENIVRSMITRLADVILTPRDEGTAAGANANSAEAQAEQ